MSPSMPPVQAAPPAPVITNPSVQAAAQATAAQSAAAMGRGSTILTSGQGDTNPITVAKKQLLGGN